MSHITGTTQVLGTPLTISAGTTPFNPPDAPGGTKFLILHFQNLAFLPGDRLQVDLGYAVDIFTAADGPAFWTRPINVHKFPTGAQITYLPAASAGGTVQLDQFARGERHVGETGHPSFSNSDPFYTGSSYLEPTYDPHWYCSDPPHWDNVAVVTDPGDVRARVARSVGMMVSIEQPTGGGALQVSTCSVTLVDADRVLTAGHCHLPEEALNSSVTFDYLTNADGSRPAGYNPRFYKVKKVIGHKNLGSQLDYSLLQLAEVPVGIPAIQLRPDRPGVGERVFGVHHPNGAVKKLSLPLGEGFATVVGSGINGVNVGHEFHVSGGSSGSGLFDTAGRQVGVLSRGEPCLGGALIYCPIPNIIADLVPATPPVLTRDVMLVFDRSGSMSSDDGTGRSKIDAARDAVSLFVQLVRAGTGNRAGLVSFSTSAGVNFAVAPVTAATKSTLIGPAPFSGGIVGGLTPGGMTTIGGGLDTARAQIAAAGPNPRAILLLTDGLQNTDPRVETIDAGLAGITVHAIGFGTESSLDGSLLSDLATRHGGQYLRAGGGLALEKFFSTAFGNIFETGILLDPEFDLPADQPTGPQIPFHVAGEEALTAVVGWTDNSAQLLIELTTPGGAVVTLATPAVTSDAGRTWAFLRLPLPVAGERNGTWRVRAVRPTGGGEFPPPAPALRYFVNVIPSGGPIMLRQLDTRRYYTGDAINPLVLVRQDNGGWPTGLAVSMTITRPDTGVGNLISDAGLGAPKTIDADVIPARQATLQAIESSTGAPAVRYVDVTFDLSSASEETEGLFEESGTFGRALPDLLQVEGNYTFHARVTYGEAAQGMREHSWSLHVDVGIDPTRTTVTTVLLPPAPDGGTCVRMTFTPRDRYGNRIGPGRLEGFVVAPAAGSSVIGPVTDLGNGSYQVDVCSGPDVIEPPRVTITQPGRDPVVVGATDMKLYVYSVKFVCGVQSAEGCGCAPVRPGRYATEINIHNPSGHEVRVGTRPIPLVVAGAPVGREPRVGTAGRLSVTRLPAHSATMSDCCRILEKVLGAPPAGATPITIGILEVSSLVPLGVTAVYTAVGGEGGVPAMQVVQVVAQLQSL